MPKDVYRRNKDIILLFMHFWTSKSSEINNSGHTLKQASPQTVWSAKKNLCPRNFFQYCSKDFKVPHIKIGSWSASLSFGTLINCVVGKVKWVERHTGNNKCPELASWTSL